MSGFGREIDADAFQSCLLDTAGLISECPVKRLSLDKKLFIGIMSGIRILMGND
ncbi:MAG TPA: hypothetical protein PLJ44_07105 [Victivallales bacterium]|nr:hypothetical protein [Victivallales bacterium]